MASTAGAGEQTLTWDVQGGNWSIVAMQPDGERGVSADVSIGVKVDVLVWLFVGLAIAGVIVLGLAVVLIIWAARRSEPTFLRRRPSSRSQSPRHDHRSASTPDSTSR